MAANLTPEQLDLFQTEAPDFFCAITLELMIDPVMTTDGHTYDRGYITQWLENHDTSPITNARLESKTLFPNHTLRNAIEKSLENFRKRLDSEAKVKSQNPTPNPLEAVALTPTVSAPSNEASIPAQTAAQSTVTNSVSQPRALQMDSPPIIPRSSFSPNNSTIAPVIPSSTYRTPSSSSLRATSLMPSNTYRAPSSSSSIATSMLPSSTYVPYPHSITASMAPSRTYTPYSHPMAASNLPSSTYRAPSSSSSMAAPIPVSSHSSSSIPSARSPAEQDAIEAYTRRLMIKRQLELNNIDTHEKIGKKIHLECDSVIERIETNYPNIKAQISPQAIEQARQEFIGKVNAVPVEVLWSYYSTRNEDFGLSDKIQAFSLTATEIDKALKRQSELKNIQNTLEKKWPEIRYRLLLDQARGIPIQPIADLTRMSLSARPSSTAKPTHPPFFPLSQNSNDSNPATKSSSSGIGGFFSSAAKTARQLLSQPAPAESSQSHSPANRPSAHCDYLFKILLMGDSAVGKSCLILWFADNIYTESFIPTIGVDFKLKTIASNESRVTLQIFDTERQERYREIRNNGPRGPHAIIVAFDVTDRKSFENVTKWLKEIDTFAGPNAIVILAATKCDVPETEWAVSKEEIKEFAEYNRKNVYFTSAKANLNVEQLFEGAANSVIQNRPQSAPRPSF